MMIRKRYALLALLALALIAVACGPAATTAPTTAPATQPTTAPAATAAPTKAATTAATSAPASTTAATSAPSGSKGPSQALIDAAKAEGTLNVIALDPTWLNYRLTIDNFKQKYGLKVNELNPDAGSGDEVEAIKANKDNKGPQAPDVIEVGYSFGDSAKADKLLAPYKVSNWDAIPNDAKDPDGNWYGLYYGAMAFAVNTSAVKNIPQDWPDLLKPDYKGQVALAGDPRTSNQAIQAVEASALANGGSLDDAMPGLDFFRKLNEAGNFVPIIGKEGTLAKGETPILLSWDYLALGDKDDLKGNPDVAVVVPKTGVFGGAYVEAISAYAPHPNAAKLWMEYLYTDEAQLIKVRAHGHPINYQDMVKRNVIPADAAKQLPSADLYAKIVFPTPAQLAKAKDTITKNWDSVVKANVK